MQLDENGRKENKLVFLDYYNGFVFGFIDLKRLSQGRRKYDTTKNIHPPPILHLFENSFLVGSISVYFVIFGFKK